jgi:hypothetical protein
MMAYMSFRFLVEFIKPSWKGYAHLSAIQWAALITVCVAAAQLRRRSAAVALEGEAT